MSGRLRSRDGGAGMTGESAEKGHNITACLIAAGWRRDDGPVDEIGECADVTGCSRPGRWVSGGFNPQGTWGRPTYGNYCAQHAHQGTAASEQHRNVSTPPGLDDA